MGWVYLDDKFPDHDKVQRAGGDAAWLFVCGLAYCNRNLTGGRIPKPAVARLSDRRAPAKLAAKLVEVGMWTEDGEHYVVHEYDHYQRTSNAAHEARADRARKAANARWEKQKRDAPSNAQASPEHMPEQCPPMPHAPGPQALTPQASKSSDNPGVVGTNGGPEPNPQPAATAANGTHADQPKHDDDGEISVLGDTLHAGLQARGCRTTTAQCEGTVREILTWAGAEAVEAELRKLAGIQRKVASPNFFRAMVANHMRDLGEPVPDL